MSAEIQTSRASRPLSLCSLSLGPEFTLRPPEVQREVHRWHVALLPKTLAVEKLTSAQASVTDEALRPCAVTNDAAIVAAWRRQRPIANAQ